MNRNQDRSANDQPGGRPATRSPATLQALFGEAVRCLQAGRLAEAEQLCRQILAVDARHVDSLHLLGLIALQTGRHAAAIDLIGQAIALRNDVPAYYNNLGNALQAHGKFADAAAQYQRALALKPDYPQAHNNLGNALKAQGRLADATAHYVRALALDPNYAQAHNNLGNARKAQGMRTDAVAHYQRAVALKPDYAEAHNNLAVALQDQGKLDEAIAHCERALALKPDYPEAHSNLGNVLLNQGKREEAIAQFGRALALRPDYAEAYNNLGNALQDQGSVADAMAQYQRALALKPDYAEAHYNLANTLLKQGKREEAIAQYGRALALRPDYAEAHNNLGNALYHQGRFADAMAQYRCALALRPDYAEAHYNLANTLLKQGKREEAIAQYGRALALRPAYPEAHNNLGSALQDQGSFADAIAHYQRALALRPDYAEAHYNSANVMLTQGRLEEAQHAYETAIEFAPDTARYYRSLLDLRRPVAGDRYMAAMERLAQNMASLPNDDQQELHFALGKAYADLEQYERSFPHLLAGNALKRRDVAYDEPAVLGLLDRIRAVFTRDLMLSKRGVGDPSAVPIFIVGMLRSGTTLAEQILASHPDVYGAGEREDFTRAVNSLRASNDAPTAFPEAVAALPDETLRQLGASYLAAVAAAAPHAARITDKMPGNFAYAGLIHLALPNARIIHMRRDPIDTCLSCFASLFAAGQPHSYDLAELGRSYRAYATLMAHWRQVLPAGGMLDVQYEDLVADVGQQAHRIVAHCGLDWDDACLAFHNTQRPVLTASAAQVRQRIYRTSVGRWQRYGDLLQPLIGELGRAG